MKTEKGKRKSGILYPSQISGSSIQLQLSKIRSMIGPDLRINLILTDTYTYLFDHFYYSPRNY